MNNAIDYIFSIPLHATLGLIAVFMLFGAFLNISKWYKLSKSNNYISNFRECFIEWCNSGMSDEQAYMKLIAQSPKSQSLLAGWGTISFKPPYANYIVHDWNIVLNGIPTIRQYSNDSILSGRTVGEYIRLVDDALLRAIGSYSDDIETTRGAIFNPITLLRDGLSFTITLPIFILSEFGLISNRAYKWIISSVFVKATTLAVAVIGFISAIIGIATGWTQFYDLISPFLKKIWS